MADLVRIPRLVEVDHGGQEALEAPSCILFTSHQTMDVPNIVQNGHGVRYQHPLFAHQYTIGNFVIFEGLAQDDVIDSIRCGGDGILASYRAVVVAAAAVVVV